MGPSLTTTNNVGILISTTADTAGSAQVDEALSSTDDSLKTLGVTAGDTSTQVTGAMGDIDEKVSSTAETTTASMTEAGEAIKGFGIVNDETADSVLSDNALIIASYRDLAAASVESAAVQDESTVGSDVAKGALGTAGLAGAISNPYVLAGAAIAGAVTIAVKEAGNFQTAMLKLYNTAGETANYQALSSSILEVSNDTGEATSQLLQAQYHISSIGYNALSGINLLKAAAEGAKEEGADVTTVANALGTVMHDYGANADQATSYMNQLLTATSVGNVTLQDLTSSLSTVLPLASKVGLSFAQIGAAEATLTEGGVSANDATQDLSALIKSLVAPTSQQVTAMQQMGLNSVTLGKDLGSEGLTGTLDELMTAVTAHTQDGQIIQSAFKSATLATQDLNTELENSPPQLQNLENSLLNGTISFANFRTQVQSLPEGLTNLGKEFEATYNQTNSFNAALAAGVNASPTVANELKLLTGQSNSMNAVLLLTGANQAVFDANNKKIAASAKDAGNNVQGWADQQKTLNFQFDEFITKMKNAGEVAGHDLTPAVTEMFKGLNEGMDLFSGKGPSANIKDDITSLVDSWLHLNDATKTTSDTANNDLSPAMRQEITLASEMGVSITTVTDKVSDLTQTQTLAKNATYLLATAKAQDKAATDAVATSDQNLTTQASNVSNAQNAVTTAAQKFGTNSPQYQTAVSNLNGTYQNYNASLRTADSNTLNLIIAGGNLASAQTAWKGDTDLLKGAQEVYNASLQKGISLLSQWGPTALAQVGSIATLQNSIGLVVTAWNGLQSSINIQQTQDQNIFQGDTGDIMKLQGQSSTLNSTLGSIQGAMNTLQGAKASIQGGTLKLTSGYATGVTNFAGGPVTVGENGPETLILPQGSSVKTNAQSTSGSSGASTNSSGGVLINQTNYNYSEFDLTAANKALGFMLANASAS